MQSQVFLLLSAFTFFLLLVLCLTASDAKERQHWVSRLQICTQHHTEAMGKVGWCMLNMFTGAYLQLGTTSPFDLFILFGQASSDKKILCNE